LEVIGGLLSVEFSRRNTRENGVKPALIGRCRANNERHDGNFVPMHGFTSTLDTPIEVDAPTLTTTFAVFNVLHCECHCWALERDACGVDGNWEGAN